MTTYLETLDYLFNLRGGEIDLRLNRMARALSLFDHPERSFKVFHVAGTNGKGSTAAMLHSILGAQGYKAALYTSPHLVSFTERIRVGDQEISPDEVVELAKSIMSRTEESGITLTFFEFVTVMALVYFARRGVDVAVVEVGLGGRLDATNLVIPAVSLITTISMDHEAYLGSDLTSIAREKGGIIKADVPVVCGSLNPEIAAMLESLAGEKGSASYFYNRQFSIRLRGNGLFDYAGLNRDLTDLSLNLNAVYQRENAAVALAALEAAQGIFPVSEPAIREGLKKVFWPGRFEVIAGRPRVILDGAHNSQGVNELIKEVRILLGNSRVRLLFGAMEDKKWSNMLLGLTEVASEMVLTRLPIGRSADPRELAQAVPAGTPTIVVEDPVEAIESLIKRVRGEETILVTGSLYLLGQVRPWLLTNERQEADAGGLSTNLLRV